MKQLQTLCIGIITSHLDNNNIGPQGATAIGRELKDLRALGISNNDIRNEGASAIVYGPRHLRELAVCTQLP